VLLPLLLVDVQAAVRMPPPSRCAAQSLHKAVAHSHPTCCRRCTFRHRYAQLPAGRERSSRCETHTCIAGHAWHWEQLDTTAAWNTRSGPQLQWLGASSRYLLFNDLHCRGPAGGIAAAAIAAVTAATDRVLKDGAAKHRSLKQDEAAGDTDIGPSAARGFIAGNASRLSTGSSAAAAVAAASGKAAVAASGAARDVAVAEAAPQQLLGDACAVVYDLQRMTRTRRLPLPVHSVSEDGARGLATNMQRLEAASPGEQSQEYVDVDVGPPPSLQGNSLW